MNIKFLLKRVDEYYKKNGLKETIRKIFSRLIDIRRNKEENKNYLLWIKNNEPTQNELEEQKEFKFEYCPKISVVVPMYNTKEKYLKELIDSLLNQTYSNWELCLADGSSEELEYVPSMVSQDSRIIYKKLEKNLGISENSNRALELATGEYIALLDHDDIIPAFALYEVVKSINENRDAEFLYTDEDKITEDITDRRGPHFKPDFGPDSLMSCNYICHFSIFRKDLMDKLGGFRKEYDGSQDHDIILRATEQAGKVVHIPKILYHWRINENSVAMSAAAKPYAFEAARKAIKAHLERMNVEATVEDAHIIGTYRVNYKLQGEPKVSIVIIGTQDNKKLQKCIKSIMSKTKYSNYEIIIMTNKDENTNLVESFEKNEKIKIELYSGEKDNHSEIYNFAVSKASGEFVVFADSEIEIITENWLEIMLAHCQRQDVGIVGAKILTKNKKVYSAGVVLGLKDTVGCINRGIHANNPGYMMRNIIAQNYSAVSGLLMMVSKQDFNNVNGMDISFAKEYNDIDLCLKIRNNKKVIVMNPFVQAYYKGTAQQIDNTEDLVKFEEKWKDTLEKEDPYFNKNFRHDIVTMRVKTNLN